MSYIFSGLAFLLAVYSLMVNFNQPEKKAPVIKEYDILDAFNQPEDFKGEIWVFSRAGRPIKHIGIPFGLSKKEVRFLRASMEKQHRIEIMQGGRYEVKKREE